MSTSGSEPMEMGRAPDGAEPGQREPLLRTKLFVPILAARHVPRPDLIEAMNASLEKALILVSAPAGFGKTQLLAEWAAQSELVVAWLSLDVSDNDPYRFLRYTLAALNQSLAKAGIPACESAQAMLQSVQPVPIQTILISLVNDLTELPEPFALVLDDYQFITNAAVHEALSFILEHFPQHGRVVLATRVDPSIPLHRLRAGQRLLEIRTDQLRFDGEETETFMNRVMEISLSREDISTLVDRTEGWIAGLQLAALSMQGVADRPAFIQAFNGSHRFILEYLLEEVLNRQPDAIQLFLLHTSILDQLCSSLCDVVMDTAAQSSRAQSSRAQSSRAQSSGAGYSQMILEHLERSNIFVTTLDEVHHWYRYHHLFADLLQARLEQTHPEILPGLHQRASRWYESAGVPETAIQHALAAGDMERAAQLVEMNGFKILSRGEMSTLFELFDSIPENILLSWARLSVIKAWALTLSGQLGSAEAQLADVESRFLQDEARGDREEIQGSVALMRALMADFRGDMASAIVLARRADELLPANSLDERSIIPFVLGDGYFATGELDKAEQAFQMIHKIGEASGNLWTIAVALHKTALLKKTQGKLSAALDLYNQAVRVAGERKGQGFGSMGAVYVGMSDILRERNELRSAQRLVDQAVQNMERWQSPTDLVNGYCVQARIFLSVGEIDQAEVALNRAEQSSQSFHIFSITRQTFEACQVRFWLATGNSERLDRWWDGKQAGQNRYPQAFEINSANEIEWITLSRVLIARNEPEAALRILDSLVEAAEAGGRAGRLVETEALTAVALWRSGRHEQANKMLRTCLALAEPEGYVRIFVDEGQVMEDLLRATRARLDGRLRGYADRLLNAFRLAADGDVVQAQPGPAGEALTQREAEVLRLLADGLSNQEIAKRLVVSEGTVKTHAHNLYGKLGVQTRIQAIARAREMGLLRERGETVYRKR